MDVGLQRYEGGNWFSVAQEMIMEWIKCSERMPENGMTVLGYCVCNSKFSGIYTMRKQVIEAKNSKKDTMLIKHERVSHWMPLPEPPTE